MEAEDGGLGQMALDLFCADDQEQYTSNNGDNGHRHGCEPQCNSELKSNGATDHRKKTRLEKLHQSEEAFQEQKRLWKPLCEESLLSARLREGIQAGDVSVTVLKNTAELQYYLRDYVSALQHAERALELNDLDDSGRRELNALVDRCKYRLATL